MDIRESGQPKRCFMCRILGHSKKNCPHCLVIFLNQIIVFLSWDLHFLVRWGEEEEYMVA
ncbi:hypothetical protein JHK82_039857 [Glycine max]|nr:hypothetical protein JHK82_039857 [Glycine max]KAG5121923.1 hypothetical protein JHK84_040263 [Glycine max]